MIDFYSAASSNGQRAAIMLEECGAPYTLHKLDLFAGDQRKPEFLAINPAGTIPAIVDRDGPGGKPLALAQSGAILLYLAAKTGRFLPEDAALRAQALQWVFQATTDTAASSMAIFLLSRLVPEKSEANVGYFEERTLRQLRVADQRLADREYLAGELS
ncbi:MAG TPA: glutathione S-transferase N-terminal domain-containing protein, partial [Casimicrobiaceae bacterium]|nr:glutathione S-transferase N-terminal domain-containing protein [Casimicrobiaceae bacterium]